jgi:hypothetical protein
LDLHHALDQRLERRRIILDQAGAGRQHAVGIALAMDVGAVGEHVRALDVVDQGRAIGLDGADPVNGPGLERLDRLGRRAHIANLHVLESYAMLLQPVIRHDLEGIELEGGKGLALEFRRLNSNDFRSVPWVHPISHTYPSIADFQVVALDNHRPCYAVSEAVDHQKGAVKP